MACKSCGRASFGPVCAECKGEKLPDRMEIMKCGECGNDTATLRVERSRDRGELVALELRCTQCKEITTIRPSTPSLILKPHPRNTGEFCTGWEK